MDIIFRFERNVVGSTPTRNAKFLLYHFQLNDCGWFPECESLAPYPVKIKERERYPLEAPDFSLIILTKINY